MDVSVDTGSDLVAAVADVRRTPLGRIAREGLDGASLRRVLPGWTGGRPAPATFQSSI
ncbi:MAG TPA: FxSxx-COOH cyclophane-containing RiPP peptide [Actinocrinis sp.]|nr:FxSxx-COOH cyclophane-containing RiPP peptide [Actinocrinis sp.]